MPTVNTSHSKPARSSLLRENRLLIVESYLRDANLGTLGRLSASLDAVAHSGLLDPDLSQHTESLVRKADALVKWFTDRTKGQTIIVPAVRPEPIQFELWVDQAVDREQENERISACLALLSLSNSEKAGFLGEHALLRTFVNQLCDLIAAAIDQDIDARLQPAS